MKTDNPSATPGELLRRAADIFSRRFGDSFPEDAPDVAAWFAEYDRSRNRTSVQIGADIRAALESSPVSETPATGWTAVAAGQLPRGAEDVLTWTITEHCIAAHPHRIRALHAEAQESGEDCFYTHWMPLPRGPK